MKQKLLISTLIIFSVIIINYKSTSKVNCITPVDLTNKLKTKEKTLIVFFSSWCGAKKSYLSEFNNFKEHLNKKDYQVIFILTDDNFTDEDYRLITNLNKNTYYIESLSAIPFISKLNVKRFVKELNVKNFDELEFNISPFEFIYSRNKNKVIYIPQEIVDSIYSH